MPKTRRCMQPCNTSGGMCKLRVSTFGEKCIHHRDVCACCREVPQKHESVKTACGHIYHQDCLESWSKAQNAAIKTCPTCRAALDDVYQWPKAINTRYFTWCIPTREYANTLIDFMDSSAGTKLVEEMTMAQFEANIYVETQDFSLLDNTKMIKATDGSFSRFAFKCRMLDNEHTFELPVNSLGTFNMATEFENVKRLLNV